MKPRSLLCSTFLALLVLPASALQSFQHDSPAKQANQWEAVQVHLKTASLPEQPADAALTATFKDKATGKELTSSGFFNGGNNYIVSFCPPATGTWSYTLASSIKDLQGLSGKITVSAPLPGRKGGIRVNPRSPREFIYDNGDDYYPICFEVDWLFALDAENAGDIPVTRAFIDRIAKDGFNQVIMNVFAYDVVWKKDPRLKPEHDYGSRAPYPFLGTNKNPDHSQLNYTYFQRLERVIDYLDQKGIASHLMIYVWNKAVNWPKADSPDDNRYFDYVVNRFQAFPNIVWDVSKEALGYGHNDVGYINRRIELLRKDDAHQRLITVHDYQYCSKFPQNVDFISVQLWQSELYHVMRKTIQDFPGKPILNIEHGGYERSPYVVFNGSYTTAETCLERAWQCVFAGTYPTHYWQGAAWNAIIPDFDTLPPADRPRLEYYRHMSELVAKYDIGSLKAGGKYSGPGFCLTNESDRFIYYVPRECEHIGINLPKKHKGRTMTGTWFNPFTGSYDAPVIRKPTQWPSFTRPSGEGFRILIVDVEK